jgi:GT2 family glycosyltransferase
MADLSIIIVSWNVRDLLRECLDSLYKYTKDITFEVFVVDNASSDGSADMVRGLFPQVNLIENKQNLGFSKANNQAIRISKGRYVALLNPDTLFIEDVFSSLIKYADGHEKIGAIGPKILNRDMQTIQYSCARRLPNLYFSFCYGTGLSRIFSGKKIFGDITMPYWDHKSSKYVEVLSGACMLVRKNAVDHIGLMDENQFMYADEIDWCKRFIDGGWDIYYYSTAQIVHFGGESSKQAKGFSKNEAIKATWYYYKKHKGEMYSFAYCFLIFFVSILKFVYTSSFRRGKKNAKGLITLYKNNFRWSFWKIIGKG